MAKALGMSIDQFHNHMYQKVGSRFFTMAELELMEDLSGTSLLADYFATRRGKLLVDIPEPESLDNVDLFQHEMQLNAVRGKLDQAKFAALADGVIDSKEKKTLSQMFHNSLRHQMHGFMGFMALYGVSDGAVDMFVASKNEVTPASVQLRASWRVDSAEKSNA
ncbi:YmfL family putative regulatory protein [Buttiauxella agrestis]|uniref:YmfL family putative regulatory protein n=1 Tax=Buttiauxella agrestis TaxID=82977 RepID=UPI003976E6DC